MGTNKIQKMSMVERKGLFPNHHFQDLFVSYPRCTFSTIIASCLFLPWMDSSTGLLYLRIGSRAFLSLRQFTPAHVFGSTCLFLPCLIWSPSSQQLVSNRLDPFRIDDVISASSGKHRPWMNLVGQFSLGTGTKMVPGSSIEYAWLEWHVKRPCGPCVFNAALTSGDESSKWRQKPDDPWGIRSWEMLRDPKFVPYELLGRYGWRSPWMLNRLA